MSHPSHPSHPPHAVTTCRGGPTTERVDRGSTGSTAAGVIDAGNNTDVAMGMSTILVDDVVPFEDWTSAARASLAFLHRTVGLDVWVVTEVQEPLQVVLHAHPEEVLPPGTAASWTWAPRSSAGRSGSPASGC